MENDLLYNASGAKDETAYKAIKNVMKEHKTMEVFDKIKKGEIWEVESNIGIGTKLVVVLNCYEKYAATVMLQEQVPCSNGVPVRAHGIMYVDAGRLGWIFYDKMVSYVRTLSQEEDQQLRRAIGKALDIEPCESLEVDIFRLREELAQAKETIDNQAEELEAANRMAELVDQQEHIAPGCGIVEMVTVRTLREDLAAARKEAEIYKGLYEAMLQRALG